MCEGRGEGRGGWDSCMQLYPGIQSHLKHIQDLHELTCGVVHYVPER